MTTAHDYASAHANRFLDEFKDLLRIPSISTLPQHAVDVQRAAEWLAADMRRIGMDSAEIIHMPGGRCPLVLGEWHGAGPDAPTALVYCHYDVQPAEMADGWDSAPFEPVERDGKLFARGAVDSKLHVMVHLKAVESLLASPDGSPVNIRLLFEGEEESGSETINAFVRQHADRLRADVGVVSDGTIITVDQPSLIVALRGIITMEVRLHGPRQDLHSGHYGGVVHNPIQALAEIIAQLHDDNGTVTVPGFYDDVRPITDIDRQHLRAALPWVEAEWRHVADPPQVWGEREFNLHERIGVRPTLEINGISGGYAAEGFKTVLPARALAKLSCRLVADQAPQRVAAAVRDYILSIAPPTVNCEVLILDEGAPAFVLDRDTRAVQAATVAYEKGWGRAPIYEWAGGSVPITYALARCVDEVVLMGYGTKSGRAHGPNENIYLSAFERGILTTIHFYSEYAARWR